MEQLCNVLRKKDMAYGPSGGYGAGAGMYGPRPYGFGTAINAGLGVGLDATLGAELTGQVMAVMATEATATDDLDLGMEHRSSFK